MNKEILNVKKRNGRGSEPLNIEKIHEMVAVSYTHLRAHETS